MIIGVLHIELTIETADSLKEKRVVLNRLRDHVRRRFNVSFAEVGENDVWNRADLAVATVANQQQFVNRVLSKVAEFIESSRDCDVEDFSMEFL